MIFVATVDGKNLFVEKSTNVAVNGTCCLDLLIEVVETNFRLSATRKGFQDGALTDCTT